MKLGVFTVLLSDMKFKDALDYLVSTGVQAIELGTGGYPGNAHCNPAELLADSKKLDELKKTIADSGLELGCLSVHGNPVHPDKAIADKFHQEFVDTVLLAEKLGVDRVVTFSGCPGGSPEDKTPNWVTCPWPDDYSHILEYQWNDVLVPYWEKTSAFAKDHGVNKIALEMHPGFCVYNPETMLKLRKAVGTVMGANFDPSHLYWQGIDAVAAIRYLGDAIQYFHAKDTRVDPINASNYGVLDTKHYGDEINRGWVFRTVGYGHDMSTWRDIFSTLKMVGYDDIVSIEHEDSIMTPKEGLEKAIKFLKDAMFFEKAGEMWWA